jgi:hypothetical protein
MRWATTKRKTIGRRDRPRWATTISDLRRSLYLSQTGFGEKWVSPQWASRAGNAARKNPGRARAGSGGRKLIKGKHEPALPVSHGKRAKRVTYASPRRKPWESTPKHIQPAKRA